ncbi:hypothetical protein BO94DRAFT_30290 [Aspergillus sclerotioniger CBS 115572]|uniref:Uncharacterized protein n=1 Tax=Aspergillus sclerotioniger CBS 115572 TaxID=1450535 RepID=A0A317X1Y9_9EURO|nr:hypothetical protein BO94DRAFT_30290 [Aspergillus sclerotioniger CBS 115572]PWY90560.1 hypothetical protein BO94DRAFT_30290 [Aspergillus sclerotioniger CBS 115572]
MRPNRRLRLSSCLRDVKRRKNELGGILQHLDRTEKTFLAGEQLRKQGIELSDLDFHSGKLYSPSAVPYFMPILDDSREFLKSTRDLVQDGDIQSRCFSKAAGDQEGGWPEDPATIMRRHLFYIQGKSDWHVIQRGKSKRGRGCDRYFEMRIAIESHSKLQSHQMLMTVMNPCASQRTMSAHEDEFTADCRPSVSELTMLVSWMLGGMIHQEEEILAMANKPRLPTLRIHVIFPTLVFSFVRPARVRILYGYFEGTLKVQATKLQDINVSNYTEMMESLV